MLGVDVGTTSTKVVAFDAGGESRARVEADYPLNEPRPGHAEQDPAAILAAVLSAVRSAAHEAEAGGAQVAGLAFSSAMHSLLALDGDGRPVTPSIIWADTRAAPQAERLAGRPDRAGPASAHRHARASDVAADQAGVVPRAGRHDLRCRAQMGRHQGLSLPPPDGRVRDRPLLRLRHGADGAVDARLGRRGARGRGDRRRPPAGAGAEHARRGARRGRGRSARARRRARRSSRVAATGRWRTSVSAPFVPASRRARSGPAERSASPSSSRRSTREAASSATPWRRDAGSSAGRSTTAAWCCNGPRRR